MPSQTNCSSQTKHFVPQQTKYTGNRAECQGTRLPSLPLGSQTSFSQCPPVTHPRAAPHQDMTRLQATQSMDDTLMTAELLCCLPAAPTCPLVHQNMHFSVSPAQWTLSVLGRDKMTHCLLQTEVVLQKHDNLLFHLMQKTKIHQSL